MFLKFSFNDFGGLPSRVFAGLIDLSTKFAGRGLTEDFSCGEDIQAGDGIQRERCGRASLQLRCRVPTHIWIM